MAAITGTSNTYGVGTAGGIREDLEDVIWDLFPADTWALSNLDRVNATSTRHEWLGDELAAAAANLQIEGDDATYASIVSPSRYANFCQISRKTFLISGTLEAVKKAGRRSEIARQAMKQMRELKRDMEFALTTNQAATAGASASARAMGGMESWLGGTASATVATTVVLATTSASATTPAVAAGAATAGPTDGTTTGALTKLALDLALEASWANGGDPNTILVRANNKKKIDEFTSIATRQIDIGRTQQAVITGAANVYVSDFGVHRVILHRYMRTSVTLCIDPDFWAIAYLRRPFSEKLAKTGDAEKYQILTEFSLVARNWKASSKVVACA